MRILSWIDQRFGRLDSLYCAMQNHRAQAQPRMFHRGWGDGAAVASVLRRWNSDEAPHHPTIDWTSNWKAAARTHSRTGCFETTQYRSHLPRESRLVHFHLIVPRDQPTGAAAVLMPTSRDAGMASRRGLGLALARRGITAVLPESPFMGLRAPATQHGTTLSHFSDFLLLAAASIEEARSLLVWLHGQSFTSLCVGGVSKGGYLAAAAGLRTPLPLHVVSLLGPHSGVPVLLRGLIGQQCDWDALARSASEGGSVRHRMEKVLQQMSLEYLPVPATLLSLTWLAAHRDGYVPPDSYARMQAHWGRRANVRWLPAAMSAISPIRPTCMTRSAPSSVFHIAHSAWLFDMPPIECPPPPRLPPHFMAHPSLWATGLFVAYALALTYAPGLLGHWLLTHRSWGVAGWALLVPLAGISGFGLYVMSTIAHEGFHFTLARHKFGSALIGVFFSSAVIGFSGVGFHLVHGRHHRHTNRNADPDVLLFSKFTSMWRRLLILRVVNNRSYMKAALQLLRGRTRSGDGLSPLSAPQLKWLALANIHAQLFWLAVYATVLRQNRELAVCVVLLPHLATAGISAAIVFIQHAATGSERCNNARTVSSRAATLLMCGTNFHLEHHLFPRVPCWKLSKVHRWLQSTEWALTHPLHVETSLLRCFRFIGCRYHYGDVARRA